MARHAPSRRLPNEIAPTSRDRAEALGLIRMIGATLIYRRLASPLHATRASVGAAWTLALIVAALVCEDPIVLAMLAGAIVCAGACAGVGRQLLRSLRMATIVALPIVLVNVLVSRDGLTVFVRLGDLGPFGQGNLTVEALVFGLVIALKVTLLMLATTLGSLAVDPDELLRGVRRLSFRSALTASLATRMIPVLATDARRLAEAQRTRHPSGSHRRRLGSTARSGGLSRSGRYPRMAVSRVRVSRVRQESLLARARERVTLVSATMSSSLDRALDVAATLELRGFAEARRAQRRAIPWSRHDLAFALCTASLAALALGSRLAGIAPFDAYPEIQSGSSLEAFALGAALGAVILLPFLDRRGIEP
jgi:energy-coupling factor transport system permease protein